MMGETDKKARMRVLDDLDKEMNNYDAENYRNRRTAQLGNEGNPPPPEPTPVQDNRPDVNPASEKPMYMDKRKEEMLKEAEAAGDSASADPILQRGQFGRSRKG